MRVSKTIETPEGGVTFDGELEHDELDMVISAGISYLMMRGALPFQVVKKENQANMVMDTDGELH